MHRDVARDDEEKINRTGRPADVRPVVCLNDPWVDEFMRGLGIHPYVARTSSNENLLCVLGIPSFTTQSSSGPSQLPETDKPQAYGISARRNRRSVDCHCTH